MMPFSQDPDLYGVFPGRPFVLFVLAPAPPLARVCQGKLLSPLLLRASAYCDKVFPP